MKQGFIVVVEVITSNVLRSSEYLRHVWWRLW